MSWEETIKKAILKPKPPKMRRKIKPKPKIRQRIHTTPDPSPDEDFGEALHEKCKCDWPLCRRKAKYCCHYCEARMCAYHYGQVVDRKVGVHGRPADEVHNFGVGHCDGPKWVFD